MPSFTALMRLFAALALAGLGLAGCVQTPALAPAVNTDPARAQVALPEPANPALPSLILIGDSTVRNGRDDGQGKGEAGQWGWGNPLAAYVDTTKVNLVNRAVGGLSSRTYLTSGHWERTLAFVKPGDVVLMQFGHNDASPLNDDKRARGTIRGVVGGVSGILGVDAQLGLVSAQIHRRYPRQGGHSGRGVADSA